MCRVRVKVRVRVGVGVCGKQAGSDLGQLALRRPLSAVYSLWKARLMQTSASWLTGVLYHTGGLYQRQIALLQLGAQLASLSCSGLPGASASLGQSAGSGPRWPATSALVSTP